MVTDRKGFVNIANHVYTIQNISQDMTKHEVLSTAFVIYKVAEMANDKMISSQMRSQKTLQMTR